LQCNSTKNIYTEYPSGFDLAIAADASYTACTSSSVTLNIASFTATTTAGDIDVSTAGYAYQWHLNGVPVSGETSATLTVSDAAQNGIYTLVVAIPDLNL
jgi:hypothetical protein